MSPGTETSEVLNN